MCHRGELVFTHKVPLVHFIPNQTQRGHGPCQLVCGSEAATRRPWRHRAPRCSGYRSRLCPHRPTSSRCRERPPTGSKLRALFPSLICHSVRARDARAREAHRSSCRQVQSQGLLSGRRPRAVTLQYITRMTISVHPPVHLFPRLYDSKLPQISKKRHSRLTPYFITRCFHRPAFQRWPLSGSMLFQRGTQSILLALPSHAGCEFHFQSVLSRVYFPHYIYRPKEGTLTYFQPCFKGQTSQRISPVFRGINTPKVPPVLDLR